MARGWIEFRSGVKAQVSTVEERLVVKIVGTLTAADRQTLDERLRNWLQLDAGHWRSGEFNARRKPRLTWAGARL